MIIEKIEEISSLPIPLSAVEAVTVFLEKHDLASLECGKYELDEKHFVNVCEAETVPYTENKMEFHGKYADIQCIIAGEEKFLYADMSDSTIIRPYSEENDVGFAVSEKAEYVDVALGSFIYFAPGELHGPGLAADSGACKCKKAIFKIRIG